MSTKIEEDIGVYGIFLLAKESKILLKYVPEALNVLQKDPVN